MPKQPIATHRNPNKTITRAKTLRQNRTKAERLLWDKLKATAKTHGLKFRQQHPLHPYIVDFACLDPRLVIELDGMSHDTQQTYDAARDKALNNAGYTIFRFSNDDVLNNANGITETIVQTALRLRQ